MRTILDQNLPEKFSEECVCCGLLSVLCACKVYLVLYDGMGLQYETAAIDLEAKYLLNRIITN